MKEKRTALLLIGRSPSLETFGRVEISFEEKPPKVLLVDGAAFVMNFFETPPYNRGHICYHKEEAAVVHLRPA